MVEAPASLGEERGTLVLGGVRVVRLLEPAILLLVDAVALLPIRDAGANWFDCRPSELLDGSKDDAFEFSDDDWKLDASLVEVAKAKGSAYY